MCARYVDEWVSPMKKHLNRFGVNEVSLNFQAIALLTLECWYFVGRNGRRKEGRNGETTAHKLHVKRILALHYYTARICMVYGVPFKT